MGTKVPPGIPFRQSPADREQDFRSPEVILKVDAQGNVEVLDAPDHGNDPQGKRNVVMRPTYRLEELLGMRIVTMRAREESELKEGEEVEGTRQWVGLFDEGVPTKRKLFTSSHEIMKAALTKGLFLIGGRKASGKLQFIPRGILVQVDVENGERIYTYKRGDGSIAEVIFKDHLNSLPKDVRDQLLEDMYQGEGFNNIADLHEMI